MFLRDTIAVVVSLCRGIRTDSLPGEPRISSNSLLDPIPEFAVVRNIRQNQLPHVEEKRTGGLLVSPIYFEQLAFDDPMAGRRSCTTRLSFIRTGNCNHPVVHGAISMKDEMFILYALINNGGFSPMTDQRPCVVRRLAAFLKSDDTLVGWRSGECEKKTGYGKRESF